MEGVDKTTFKRIFQEHWEDLKFSGQPVHILETAFVISAEPLEGAR